MSEKKWLALKIVSLVPVGDVLSVTVEMPRDWQPTNVQIWAAPLGEEERVTDLEAQCAAMREALDEAQWGSEGFCSNCGDDGDDPRGNFRFDDGIEPPHRPSCIVGQALASDAGKAWLERLEKAERLAEMGGLSAADVRNRALEEAAKVADELADIEDGDLVGHAIRALKEKP